MRRNARGAFYYLIKCECGISFVIELKQNKKKCVHIVNLSSLSTSTQMMPYEKQVNSSVALFVIDNIEWPLTMIQFFVCLFWLHYNFFYWIVIICDSYFIEFTRHAACGVINQIVLQFDNTTRHGRRWKELIMHF